MVSGTLDEPDVVMTTEYEPLLAVSEDEMPITEFLSGHVALEEKAAGKAHELMALLGHVIDLFHSMGQRKA